MLCIWQYGQKEEVMNATQWLRLASYLVWQVFRIHTILFLDYHKWKQIHLEATSLSNRQSLLSFSSLFPMTQSSSTNSIFINHLLYATEKKECDMILGNLESGVWYRNELWHFCTTSNTSLWVSSECYQN